MGLIRGRIRTEDSPLGGSIFYFKRDEATRGYNPSQDAVTERPSSAGELTSATGGLRVLLVEDNRINQRLAVILLERDGHSVEVAGNGRAALEAMERESFDLVLMDLQMPDMDGLDATRELRKRESHRVRQTPIVAMTASVIRGERERCVAAGMDDYIVKPIELHELRRVLRAATLVS